MSKADTGRVRYLIVAKYSYSTLQFGQQPCSIIADGHLGLCNLSLPTNSSSSANHRIEAVANAEAEAVAVAEAGAVRRHTKFFEHSFYLNTLKSNMFGAY